MSGRKTFPFPAPMALHLLAASKHGRGAGPEVADAGEQIGIERNASADIDQR